VLSYHTFSRLLEEATPRQDLRNSLSQMKPISIFRRPASTREYNQRSKGAYYLISLLKQLENHVVSHFLLYTVCTKLMLASSFQSSDAYKNLVKYFDKQFQLILPSGRWNSMIFYDKVLSQNQKKKERRRSSKKGLMITSTRSSKKGLMITSTDSIGTGSADEMPGVSHTSESDDDSEGVDDYDSEDSEQVLRASRSLNYYGVSTMTPLSTSPAWDEVNASLNIRLTGSDSLKGLCDDAHFARSHLKKTMTALLTGSTQAKAALFCLEQLQSEDISEDLQTAFAKLLPHSLLHAKQFKLSELKTAIQQLQTRHLIYERLPAETQRAITDYSNYLQLSEHRPLVRPVSLVPQDNMRHYRDQEDIRRRAHSPNAEV
jgi:hypothetical protein